jgi:hypothetical protein
MKKPVMKFGRKYNRGYNEVDMVADLQEKGVYRFTNDMQRFFAVYKDSIKIDAYEELEYANKHIAKVNSSSKITNLIKMGIFSLF